jgi:hypothetical protein
MPHPHAYFTSDRAWDAYTAVERIMFEAAAAELRRYNSSELEMIEAHASEAGSDVAAVCQMILGTKEIPEGWRIHRA